jgi:hypothetical protein
MQGLRRFVLCPIAAIAVVSVQAALADQQIGNVVQRHFNGAVGLRTASAGADDLIFDRDVFAGEMVKTPGSASTVIRFEDKTQIQVGANSSIVLDKFVYDPASGTGDAAIKFGTGVFRFITGDIKNKDAVKLSTPTTSLTIRGTKFILAVAADGTTTLGVLEGAVDVAPCGGNQPVRENTGQAVQVGPSCKADHVSLGSVPTDMATLADYEVSEAPSGAGGIAASAAMAAAGGSVAGAMEVAGAGEAAVAGLVEVVATPTTSLPEVSNEQFSCAGS